MAVKGWSKRFDEPIVLDDGTTLTTLTTLRDAIEHLAKTVPEAEHNHPSVLPDPVRRARLPAVLCPRRDVASHPSQQGARVQSRSQRPSLGKA